MNANYVARINANHSWATIADVTLTHEVIDGVPGTNVAITYTNEDMFVVDIIGSELHADSTAAGFTVEAGECGRTGAPTYSVVRTGDNPTVTDYATQRDMVALAAEYLAVATLAHDEFAAAN